MKTPKKPKLSAVNHACYLLNRREYSKHELQENLVRKGHEPEEVQKAIEKLEEMGIQSDERAMKSLISMGQSRRYGPKKIAMLAKQKGLHDDLVETVQTVEHDWSEQAQQLIERKFGSGPYDWPTKLKITRTLLSKGYSYDQAMEISKNQGGANEDFSD